MLVSTDILDQHLGDPGWVIFDCRHDLADADKGTRAYRSGHIPGAHFAPVETALSGIKTGANGRHPLPEPDAFVDFLTRHGVSDASTIVAYDDVGGQYSARLWWMARWVGLSRVAQLDGGFPKWSAEGRPVATEIPEPRRETMRGRTSPEMIWTTADVEKRRTDPLSALVDARTPERYRGESEPIDPIAGRIPGALNRFYKANLNSDLTLRPREELRREFELLLGSRRPENVGHQCGSGVTACANLFAMEYAGLTGSKLYVGSWSEWIADPLRPVAKGA
jgi:thiosulfate/3-mercaptopyruvate sulfurtransferase